MYSPADLPSRLRAAPAKKRRLSAENGISSREAMSGLPTFTDSSCASSSALSSIRSASLRRNSERSFGVFSSQSGSAASAASTARSTSSAPQRGTSAIVSPVAGAITSIVSPEDASASSPPIRILYRVAVVLIVPPCSHRRNFRRLHTLGHLRRTAPADARVSHHALRERDRYGGDDDDEEGHDVDDRQFLPLPDVVEDPDRKSLLRAGRERRHDDLVEGEREREQAACDESRRQYGPEDEAERLPSIRAEILRRLDQRSRRPAQARDDVVVDDDDAEGRVADHDRPDRGLEPGEVEERDQSHRCDDPRQRERQDEQERHRLPTEEAVAGNGGRGHRSEHERDDCREGADLHRELEGAAHAG